MMEYDELDDSCHGCGEEKTGVIGTPLDFSIKGGCEAEIKADMVVKEFQSVRIWGQVKDCHNRPVPKVLLKLLRCDCGRFTGVAHTISDCQGFYQFDLWDKFAHGTYKILAGRPISGAERVLQSPSPSSKCGESCNKTNTNALPCVPPYHCKPPACAHCGKNACCKTCAYYDEATGICCLENRQGTMPVSAESTGTS